MRIRACRSALAFCVLLVLIGCGGDGPFFPFVAGDGTGVPNLDQPDDFLQNPFVEELIDNANREGMDITPQKGIDPPVISGTYRLTGRACYFFDASDISCAQLTPGTWRWFNQTPDDKIDTEYEQIVDTVGQRGAGALGEIIRGSANRFTVYSVLRVNDLGIGGCEELMVIIVDGERHSNGDITATYIGVPAKSPICHVKTAGQMELELTGPAAAPVVNVDGGQFLMKMVTDIERNPGE